MGNRMEVRVRGNAHQLLEKYKQLARDASQAGDRVAAEYYLQHADHYFRVLSEFRSRQEEQRPRHGRDFDEDEDDSFEAPEPLRVAEMTPVAQPAPQAQPQMQPEADGDDEQGGGDESEAPVEVAEVPEDRPRRRRRRTRRDEAGTELAPADA
jgi:hypothetical protein